MANILPKVGGKVKNGGRETTGHVFVVNSCGDNRNILLHGKIPVDRKKY